LKGRTDGRLDRQKFGLKEGQMVQRQRDIEERRLDRQMEK